MFKKLAICVLMLGAATNAMAFTHTVDFSAGGAPFSNPPWCCESVQPTGGNPDAFFQMASSFGPFRNNPMPRTFLAGLPEADPWHGNYRLANVTGIGFDAITIGAANPVGTNGSIFIYSDMGTPSVSTDDEVYYFVVDRLPDVGEGWISYQVMFDSQSTVLPTGWGATNGNFSPLATNNWETGIKNITMVGFFFGDLGNPGAGPGFTAVGIDNAWISYDAQPIPVEDASFGTLKAKF